LQKVICFFPPSRQAVYIVLYSIGCVYIKTLMDRGACRRRSSSKCRPNGSFLTTIIAPPSSALVNNKIMDFLGWRHTPFISHRFGLLPLCIYKIYRSLPPFHTHITSLYTAPTRSKVLSLRIGGIYV